METAYWASAAMTGALIAGALCGYVALSVELRGCNPWLDHSTIGVPLCPERPAEPPREGAADG